MNKVLSKIVGVGVLVVLILAGIGLHQKNKITFSVIIPVYNAEKYLERCLDSVFAQKGDFDVIAVNDGSQDSSLQILQKYEKKYPQMQIINQKNQGVSAARNSGLVASKSKYVAFVDSDDWLEPDAFVRVLEIIKKDKSDVVLTGYYDVYDRQWVRDVKGEEAANEVAEENKFADRKLDKLALFSPFYGKEAHSDLFYAGGGVRARFFRKEFLDKYKLDFATQIQSHEDDVFLFRVYLHNPLISVLNFPIYNYLNRADSISKSSKVLDDMPKSLSVMEQTSEFQNAPRHIQLLIRDSWLGLVFLGIANLQRHGASVDKGYEQAYQILKSFDIYNHEELKICRNYWSLYEMLFGKKR